MRSLLPRQSSRRRMLAEFLSGANAGVINADLQARLKNMVDTAGGRVRAVRTLSAQTVGQTRYIGSRLEFQGSLPSVHRAIAAIEAAKPYLLVRGAVIKPAAQVRAMDAAQEPSIAVELEVFGALRSTERAQ
jgi:Type II secretion system (T2SS), protein M subtype b